MFSYLHSLLFDSTFGTSDQMRVQLQIDYTAKRLLIPVGKKLKVDAMVILPKLRNDEEETERTKMARLSSLDKKFED